MNIKEIAEKYFTKHVIEEKCYVSKNEQDIFTDGFINGYKFREFEIKQIERVNENRGAFIDWCAANHEEILKEYTGFLEAQK